MDRFMAWQIATRNHVAEAPQRELSETEIHKDRRTGMLILNLVFAVWLLAAVFIILFADDRGRAIDLRNDYGDDSAVRI